ncbi:MAG: DUF1844 domain-containing protein [Candidatus Omnitrophica bacterium]|nr:DUF1844 domain-containing protein [Candidatus Omnitrophota bacterium]MCM8799567.1 DUF1844 domain-containing protein [Candidatus Omnitrophota bacterium]
MEEKHIDENWKEAVEKEKQRLKEKGEFIPAEPDFNFFITTLGLQASIALGQIPNPITNRIEEDLKQAKFLIDTLALIKEKTKGNLAEEEENLLDNLLYELRIQYIDKINKKE